MSEVRRVARNISYLFVYQALSRLLGLVINVVLARKLADAGYGRYSVILVVVMIAGMAADFGSANIIVREVSRRREKANQVLASALLLRGLTTVMVALAVLVILLAGGVGGDYFLPLMIATLSIIPTSLSTAIEAGFQGFERMDLSALADVIFSLVLTAAGVAVLYSGGGIAAMTVVYLAASCVRLGYSSLFYRRLDRERGGWSVTRESFAHLARESFPVLYWQLISLAYYKVDILLLEWLRDDAEVGRYAAAYKLFEIPVMFGWLAVHALLPVMSRFQNTSKEKLFTLFEKTLKYIWVTGLGAAIMMVALSAPVIRLLFPPEFEPSVDILRVLGLAVPFMVGTTLFGNLYIALGVQGRMAKWSLLSLAANVGLNLLFIPAYGAIGAAMTTLFADVLSFVVFYGFCAYFLRGVRLREVFAAPLAAAFASLTVLRSLSECCELQALAAAGAAAVYIGSLLLFRVISKDDMGYFRQLRNGGGGTA
ncbi:MAG: flippase [Gaiellales bacterium]|nr:MAG: flippase [Gaiellales bacterium]